MTTAPFAIPLFIRSLPFCECSAASTLFPRPGLRWNHSIISVIGHQISEMLSRMLDDPHPSAEVLHCTLIAALLEGRRTIGERFFHERDDFRFGFVLRGVLVNVLRVLAESGIRRVIVGSREVQDNLAKRADLIIGAIAQLIFR